MRIAVAGVGRIGLTHARNLVDTPGVGEVVLYEPMPGRAQEVAADLDGAVPVRAADSGDAAVTDLLDDADGLLVATPTPSHPQLVHAALDAGVPTLVEKPLARELRSIREVIEHVDRSGVPVVVGFQRRFDPAIAEMRRRIASGEIGDLYYVRAVAFDASPPSLDYIAVSGGIFRDLFIHDLDCVPWLVGRDVVEVYATGSVLVDPGFADADDVDTAVISLVFEGGVVAQIAGGRRPGIGYDNRVEAVGSAQALSSGLDARSPLVSLEQGGQHPGADAHPSFTERYAQAYAREVSVFIDVICGAAPNPSPVHDSLVSLALADACEASRRSGRPVVVDPASLCAWQLLVDQLLDRAADGRTAVRRNPGEVSSIRRLDCLIIML